MSKKKNRIVPVSGPDSQTGNQENASHDFYSNVNEHNSIPKDVMEKLITESKGLEPSEKKDELEVVDGGVENRPPTPMPKEKQDENEVLSLDPKKILPFNPHEEQLLPKKRRMVKPDFFKNMKIIGSIKYNETPQKKIEEKKDAEEVDECCKCCKCQ